MLWQSVTQQTDLTGSNIPQKCTVPVCQTEELCASPSFVRESYFSLLFLLFPLSLPASGPAEFQGEMIQGI